MGTRVVRTEDPRLLTSGATYVDDLRIPELIGAAHASFVRSPLAHARITGIDTTAAKNEPGVVAVFTADDLTDVPEPTAQYPKGRPAMAEPLLAREVVRYVGEPVAVVLTDEYYQGEDAAGLVDVDYEPLPAVVGFEEALDGSTLLFPDAGTNVATEYGDDPDPSAFDGCEVVVEGTFVNQRVAPAPMEVRAAAAAWGDDGRLTLWTSTQHAQGVRDIVVGLLGLDEGQVRVVTPDVGGGFGAKGGMEREPPVAAWVARRLGRAVRWIENRSENMTAMTHGRAQRHRVKIGGTRDGRLLAYRLDVDQDCGAYDRLGTFLPRLTLFMTSGVYDIPHVEGRARCVVTTTTPVSAYRGAGRPEATAAIERAIDMFAAEIGADPAKVRRDNFVPPEKFPYATHGGVTYDTGEYAKALDAVLDAGGYEELREEQRRRREKGDAVQLGLGLSTYVEITAIDAQAGEYGRVQVHPDGTATAYTGSSPHGQGHATAWAMLVHDELGIPFESITVLHGDTDAIPQGSGTMGSRSLQLGGTAVHRAAVQVKDDARRLAADALEANENDLDLDIDEGLWRVRGTPRIGVGWAELAERAGPDGLVAEVQFTEDRPTFPFGAHLAVVEVDVETGKVRLVRHVTVDDAGRVVNPILAEGQRHGGIAQGAAQALLEEMVFDSDGNPTTSTFADYGIVTAAELPSFELLDMQTPTDLNPLGVKGIGEAGTIGSTPAVQNAVVDALSYLGVRHVEMPTTPQRVWEAINRTHTAKDSA